MCKGTKDPIVADRGKEYCRRRTEAAGRNYWVAAPCLFSPSRMTKMCPDARGGQCAAFVGNFRLLEGTTTYTSSAWWRTGIFPELQSVRKIYHTMLILHSLCLPFNQQPAKVTYVPGSSAGVGWPYPGQICRQIQGTRRRSTPGKTLRLASNLSLLVLRHVGNSGDYRLARPKLPLGGDISGVRSYRSCSGGGARGAGRPRLRIPRLIHIQVCSCILFVALVFYNNMTLPHVWNTNEATCKARIDRIVPH